MITISAKVPLRVMIVAALVTFAVALVMAQQQPVTSAPSQKKIPQVTVTQEKFHGFDATVLRNHVAEIILVPSIGRIMEFNFTDANPAGQTAHSLLWSNPAIGPQQAADVEGWRNYGGDKVWPAPQSDWPKITGSPWPPPKTFDSTPYALSINGNQVELLSAVDSKYGIRVRRTIELDPQQPLMTVKTTFEKIEGTPISVAIFTISQVNEPERAFILLPEHSSFPSGYINLLKSQPDDLKSDHRLFSLVRDPKVNTMIGSDGDNLLWVGENTDLLIQNKTATLLEGKNEWPQGLHSKIYTNGNNGLKYVELELFTPLALLKPADSISMEATYTLLRRTEHDPMREARKIFNTK